MGGRVVSPIHLFSKRSHVAEASGALSDSGLEHKSKSKSADSSPAQSQKQATVKKNSLPLPKSVSRVNQWVVWCGPENVFALGTIRRDYYLAFYWCMYTTCCWALTWLICCFCWRKCFVYLINVMNCLCHLSIYYLVLCVAIKPGSVTYAIGHLALDHLISRSLYYIAPNYMYVRVSTCVSRPPFYYRHCCLLEGDHFTQPSLQKKMYMYRSTLYYCIIHL